MIGLYVLIYILVGVVVMYPLLTDFMVMCFDGCGTIREKVLYLPMFLVIVTIILTLWPVILVATIFR